MLPTSYINVALNHLRDCGISPSALFISLLSNPELLSGDAVSDIREHLDMILTACKQNSRLRDLTLAWASAAMTDICMAEINTLTNKAAGMHFNARRATCEKLEEFDLVEIAAKMRTHAPYLWQFLRRCLEARPSFARRRKARRRRQRVVRPAHVTKPGDRPGTERAIGVTAVAISAVEESDDDLWAPFGELAASDIPMEVDEVDPASGTSSRGLADAGGDESESEREYWEDMEPLPLPEDPDDADEHIADSEESSDRWEYVLGMVGCYCLLGHSSS